ncbi:hypothetical protein AB0M45_22895 [Nocardia sp. NPDC051787]|uniref:helix-turn-helix domain-containing protein n=1 Tax=Nocardia sp. NPDC051787 TaxID=3155415 RepID=UPI00344379B6
MIVNRWTGVEVRALRVQALRRSQREFAEMTGFSEAVVRKWERRGATISLAGEFAAGMDTLLRHLDDEQAARFRTALRIDPSVTVGADYSAAAVEARISDLRRALDAHDVPDDGPIRSVELLRNAVTAAVNDRLNSNYLRLACELPGLLGELHRARLVRPEVEVDRLLVQAYRAADAIADKYGYYDLSARIITMMQDTAARTGDELLGAATTYRPASVRIHQVSLGVEMGDAGAALAAACDWAPSGQVPAERRSHFYIDVARAHMLARQRDNVLGALYEAQSIAPQHTGSHPLVKELLTLL